MLRQVALNQVLRVIHVELEHHVDLVNVPSVQADGVAHFCVHVLVSKVVVGDFDRTSDLRSACESKEHEIDDKDMSLADERCELKAPTQSITEGVNKENG